MNTDLREKIQRLGDKGLDILGEYFEGTRHGTDKVKEATRMAQLAVQVEHMDQIKEQGDKSLAMRLIKHLPQDKKIREEYIRLTNPALKTLLIPKVEDKA